MGRLRVLPPARRPGGAAQRCRSSGSPGSHSHANARSHPHGPVADPGHLPTRDIHTHPNPQRRGGRQCHARHSRGHQPDQAPDEGLLISWKLSALVAFGLVTGIVLAHLTQGSETASRSWDALRAAGFTAYLLLWFSSVSGLAVRLRLRPGSAPLTWLLEAHRVSGALALAFVAGHVAGILVDPWTDISAMDVARGATSPYRPAAVLLGSVALC